MRTIIGHVTKVGHKCRNPLRTPPASYIKAGERLQFKNYELYYAPKYKAYYVREVHQIEEFHEFFNFNCAAAKLAELGGL